MRPRRLSRLGFWWNADSACGVPRVLRFPPDIRRRPCASRSSTGYQRLLCLGRPGA